MRILWADDQREVAKTLSLSLAPGRHKITFVADGIKALNALTATFFDVVVLDLAMPPDTWGGIWLLEQLQDVGIRVPVIVLSGQGRQPETIKAIRLGARDFITKEQARHELQERLAIVIDTAARETEKTVLTSFPSPLALAYKRYLTADNPQRQMRAIFDAYENMARLTTIVGLAEAASENVILPSDLISRLARPSLGVWQETSTYLCKRLSDTSCARTFRRATEDCPVEEVISTRNDVAHGSEFGDLKAADWVHRHHSPLRDSMRRLNQRFPFRLFSVLASAYDGARLVHSVAAVEGENSVLPRRNVLTRDNLVLNHAHVQGFNGEPISLHPLLLVRPGATLNSWAAHLFDGWQLRNDQLSTKERVRFCELWTGERSHDLGIDATMLPASIRDSKAA